MRFQQNKQQATSPLIRSLIRVSLVSNMAHEMLYRYTSMNTLESIKQAREAFIVTHGKKPNVMLLNDEDIQYVENMSDSTGQDRRKVLDLRIIEADVVSPKAALIN